jgi:dihydroflavonol-4-reductase
LTSGSIRTAAVTGATGLVGSLLATRLVAEGVRLRLLEHSRPIGALATHSAVEVIQGDVTDAAVVARLICGVDAVFHTAAVVSPWVADPLRLYAVNVDGTRNVVRLCESNGIRLVCTSSVVVLDPYPPPLIVRMLDGNHYVKSKRAARRLICEARARGASVWSVSPSAVLGADDTRTGLARLVDRLVRGSSVWPVFKGGLYVVNVEDVADAHVRALQLPPDDYLLPGEYWELERLFITVAGLAKHRLLLLPVPWWAAVLGAAPLVAGSKFVTHEAPILTPAWAYYFAHVPRYHSDAERLGVCPHPVLDELRKAVDMRRVSALA